ncbi:winged helix-turn-helix domain-containing protein [Enterococcus rotai]|uniref:winged helix-turn-helix domain-containing protein n=1 Tax=Enterococcus rotai TaxID=118060 RepID=UPI0032B32CC3
MYKLGVIKEDSSQSAFTDEISSNATFDISLFNYADRSKHTISEMSIILIEEGLAVKFETICETILELRKSFKGIIWILSEEISDFHKMIYFQLGIDGISNIEANLGLILLQLDNIMKHTNNKEELKALNLSTKKTENFSLNEGSLSLVLKDGLEVFLTKLEFLVVRELFNHAGETLTYEDIYQKIWVEKQNEKKVEPKFRQYRITNIIFHIRKKFEEVPGSPEYIKTVRSKGYKLVLK